MADDETGPAGWWNSAAGFVLLVFSICIPLLAPQIPPLNDLPNHMARFHIALAGNASPHLSQWYDYQWAAVPNIGFDILIVPMAKLFGLEFGSKLLVIMTFALTAIGMLALAREIHGRIPSVTLFALPLAYNFGSQMGFLNFTLGMALTMLASALWLHVRRREFNGIRIGLFPIISTVLFFIHSQAWGLFGIIIYGLEVQYHARRGRGYIGSAVRAVISCLPLLPPVLLALLWLPKAPVGGTFGFLYWPSKPVALMSVFRDNSMIFDLLSALLLYALIYVGIFRKYLVINQKTRISLILLLVVFLLMPVVVMASSFNDSRIAPYLLALAVLSLRPQSDSLKLRNQIALAALLFIGCRIASETVFFFRLDRAYRAQLTALERVPVGSRIFSLVNLPCFGEWDSLRLDHLSQMAIVRRDAFVNGQWGSIAMLKIHYPQAGKFALSPSHQTFPEQCNQLGSYSPEYAIQHLPRAAFDYIWLIDFPRKRWPSDKGLQPIWNNGSSILYQINHAPRIL